MPNRPSRSVNFEINESVYEAVTAAANQRGVSVTREMRERLQFSIAEAAPSGPEIEKITSLIAAAFRMGGDVASGSPRTPPEVWLKSPRCYLAATNAVLKLLEFYRPNQSTDDYSFDHARGSSRTTR